MARKPENTFADALKAAKGAADGAKKEVGRAASQADAAQSDAPDAKPKRKTADNKHSLYLPHQAVYKALLDLQHAETKDRRPSLNDYFLEGIDRVFADRGLPSIAELIKKAEG